MLLQGDLQHFLAFHRLSHLSGCLGMERTVLDLLRFYMMPSKSTPSSPVTTKKQHSTYRCRSHTAVFSGWDLALNFIRKCNRYPIDTLSSSSHVAPQRVTAFGENPSYLSTERLKILSKVQGRQIRSKRAWFSIDCFKAQSH